jgi:peptidoglycan hydrolase CwlO-like protein
MFPTFGLDKIVAQLIGIGLVLALIVGGYFWWESSVRKEALRDWNFKQIQQVQKENENFMNKLGEVNKKQEEITKELDGINERMDKKFEELTTHLNSPETIKKYHDKPASDVLKRTFKELNKR